MDAKEFLRQPQKLDLLVRNKIIEKRLWKDIALGITASMDGERVQSSGSQQKMADAVNKCVDIESEIDGLIDRLIDKKKHVLEVIEQLDSPTEYNVLHLRYIQYKSLLEISEQYGKDYGWATTVHGRALKNVEKLLGVEKPLLGSVSSEYSCDALTWAAACAVSDIIKKKEEA